MSVSCAPVCCLRNRSSAWYLCISPLHHAFRILLAHSRDAVSTAVRGWAPQFDRWLAPPPAHPLNPINPDNARILRITAAAGTELADAFSSGTLNVILLLQQCFTSRNPSSHTRRCSIRLSPIVEDSLLLPPVGVWAVSQSHCGRSVSQLGYASSPW